MLTMTMAMQDDDDVHLPLAEKLVQHPLRWSTPTTDLQNDSSKLELRFLKPISYTEFNWAYLVFLLFKIVLQPRTRISFLLFIFLFFFKDLSYLELVFLFFSKNISCISYNWKLKRNIQPGTRNRPHTSPHPPTASPRRPFNPFILPVSIIIVVLSPSHSGNHLRDRHGIFPRYQSDWTVPPPPPLPHPPPPPHLLIGQYHLVREVYIDDPVAKLGCVVLSYQDQVYQH